MISIIYIYRSCDQRYLLFIYVYIGRTRKVWGSIPHISTMSHFGLVMVVLFDSLAVCVRGSFAFLLTTTYHYTGVIHYSFYYLTHDSSISSSFMILATLNLTFRHASVKHVVELGYALLFLLDFLNCQLCSTLLRSALLYNFSAVLFYASLAFRAPPSLLTDNLNCFIIALRWSNVLDWRFC